MKDRKSWLRATTATVLLAGLAAPAWAERPMAVDDAGTLERGGAKLEFGWSRDDRTRGFDGAAGFGPFDDVEVEVGFEHARDRDPDPDAKIRAVGAALKWVPLQAEAGLSAGLKYEYARERVRGEGRSHTHALAGLATWAFEQGPRVHVNFGRSWTRNDEDLNFWGVGLALPLNGQVDFVVETFGEEHSGPDRQIGLRYTIVDGLKVSAAVGRGNGRTIANAGIAWEF